MLVMVWGRSRSEQKQLHYVNSAQNKSTVSTPHMLGHRHSSFSCVSMGTIALCTGF